MKKYETMFQIGEVASLLNITRKTILDYEAAGLIKPAFTDSGSGYRYFDIEAISKLQLVLELRRADMPIKTIKKYLSGNFTVNEQITAFHKRINQIENAINILSFRDIAPGTVGEVKEVLLQKEYCVCKEFTATDLDAAVKSVAAAYYDCYRNKTLLACSYNFCEFPKNILSDDFFDITNIEMRICITANNSEEAGNLTVFEKTKAVSALYRGNYENIVLAYVKIREYIKKNGLTPSGYPREYYIEGEFNAQSGDNIVGIAVPIEE